MEKLNIENYKNFKKGDVLILTDKRSRMGLPSAMWAVVYDRDVTDEEAAELHYDYMKKIFPGVADRLGKEGVVKTIGRGERHFTTSEGGVKTYASYEKADIFDVQYLKGEISENEEEFYNKKKSFCIEHNIPIFSDLIYRVYPEMLSKQLTKQI